MTDSYDDIIHLPRPISKTRPKMAPTLRAAQFSPFAALTGYEAAIKETARLTDSRVELDEGMQDILRVRLQTIEERIKDGPEVTITYFKPDPKKAGGAYIKACGRVRKVDEYKRSLRLDDGQEIPLDEVTDIEGELFDPKWVPE
ncbi:MAG: YolD-like family protein [Firmicutes bacterium]|nr:YolD-like family protein [Bacillota bacterium]